MRLSYSTIDVFKQCKRWFYYKKILKLPEYSDKKYMYRGTLVHKLLENYYTGEVTDVEELKNKFETGWNSYGLNLSMGNQKENTWTMVLNGILRKIEVTDCEYKFRFDDPDFIGYADIVDTKNHVVGDFKTSTWRPGESETCYQDQMLHYAWAYHKEFGVIPTTDVYFLKPNKIVYYDFTPFQIEKVEYEIFKINKFIETAERNETEYSRCSDDPNECPHFCTYKEQCFSKEIIKFELLVSGPWIRIQNQVSELLKKMLVKKFSYEVQDSFFVKQNSKWDGVVKLYNERTQTLGIGFLEELKKILEAYCNHRKKGFLLSVKDVTKETTDMDCFSSLIRLRDYQKEAVDIIMRDKIGIVEVATGGGKTEIAIAAMNNSMKKSLFIVNRIELLEQTKKRIERNLFCDVGVIQGDRVETDKQFTVATVQTLVSNIKDLKGFFDTVGFVVFDECHATAAKTYSQIHKALKNCTYRIGLSATPFRDDGNDMKIKEFGGETIFKKTPKELMEEDHIMYPTINFVKYNSIVDLKKKYISDYDNNIIYNEDRNNIVANIVKENKDKKILILVKRVIHGEILNDMIEGSFYINGKTPEKKRKFKFELFNEDKLSVLIATASIAQQGLDIADLDIIISADAHKGDVPSIQILGRVLRKAVGKEKATYYDFIDQGAFTRKHSLKRADLFKQLGYDVNIIEEQNI